MGYVRANDICQMDTYHGFLFIHPDNDKSRLIFDYNERLSGIQTAIPGNLMGFNSRNQSVEMPTPEIIPPILLSKEKYGPGLKMYTITAYFKHPSSICGNYQSRIPHPGKGLYIQMGYNVQREWEKIPLNSSKLSKEWKTGVCLPQMGVNYFKRLSPDMPCERLYPVFLLYNDHNQLGGFGWLFQGTPPPDDTPVDSPIKVNWFDYPPQFYPALFNKSMLPPCMFNPQFRVFGVRIYLRHRTSMGCEPRIHNQKNSSYKADHEDKGHGHGHKPTKVTLRPFVDGTFSLDTNFEVPEYANPIGTDQKIGRFSNKHHRNSNSNDDSNVIMDDVLRDQGDGASDGLFSSRRDTIVVALVSSIFVPVLCGLLTSSINFSLGGSASTASGFLHQRR